MKYGTNIFRVTALLILAAVLLTGCGSDAPAQTTTAAEETTQPAETQTVPVDVLEVVELREEGALVAAETTYCTVSYPYAFSDLIALSCLKENGADYLVFSAAASQGEYPLFYLCFGQDAGILLGQLVLPVTGETVPVYAGLYTLDETVAESDRDTCLAVQECINDVIASLGENENYTPAE